MRKNNLSHSKWNATLGPSAAANYSANRAWRDAAFVIRHEVSYAGALAQVVPCERRGGGVITRHALMLLRRRRRI